MDQGRCPFEKAILSVRCDCELATRFSIAEQIGVNCRSGIARNNCTMLLALMRERARFALKVTNTDRKSTRLNSSHGKLSRMPSSA